MDVEYVEEKKRDIDERKGKKLKENFFYSAPSFISFNITTAETDQPIS